MDDKPTYARRNGSAKLLWESDTIEEAAQKLREQKDGDAQ